MRRAKSVTEERRRRRTVGLSVEVFRELTSTCRTKTRGTVHRLDVSRSLFECRTWAAGLPKTKARYRGAASGERRTPSLMIQRVAGGYDCDRTFLRQGFSGFAQG